MISNENLNILIESLEDYKRRGVVDPWILNTGEVIEPLDALIELRNARATISKWEAEFGIGVADLYEFKEGYEI